MKPPKLCVNKQGIFYVYVNRKRHYLGKCDKRAAEIRYKAFLRKLLDDEPTPEIKENDSVYIVELSALFLQAHKNYYVKHGSQSKQLDRFKVALSFIDSLYPELDASDFGAKKLVEVRDAMIASGRFCRTYINTLIVCLRHVFTWAVAQEYVKPETLVSLRAVAPLKRGKVDVKEASRILPVDAGDVDKTIPFLPPTVAAIVTVQRFTGMRPSEVLNMRVRDLQPYGLGFKYTLESDKTSYRRAADDFRIVYIGERAAKSISPYIAGKDPDQFVFPANEETNTPYLITSYGRAITRAAKQAKAEHWSPYQLRHLFATEVRKQFGLEAAQTVLGHKRADVTQIYAERDNALAAKVASKIG